MKPRALPRLSARQIEIFWSKVHKLGERECWIWLGSTTGRKHSTLRYGTWKVSYQNMRPHRVAYSLLVATIGEDLTIDHLCRNTLCVNPGHMELVTLQENVARRVDSSVPHIHRKSA